MTAAGPGHRRAMPARATRALLAFLVVATAIGIAATYLAAPPAGAASGAGELPLTVLSLKTLGWVLLALVIVPFAFYLLYRARVRGSFVDQRAFVSLLVIALLCLLFLVVARSIGYGAPPAQNDTAPPGSTGVNDSSPPPGHNVSIGGFGPAPILPGVPGWVGYAVLIGIVTVVLVLVVYRLRPEPAPAPEDPLASVRARLRRALTDLSEGGSTDPRQVIIALYANLLDRIGPNLERLEAATPREIAVESVRKLGIGRVDAETLTGLFEEARYSTHPLSPARVAEARSALAGALSDLRGPAEEGA